MAIPVPSDPLVDTPLFADTSTPNPTVSPTPTKKTEGPWKGVVSKDNAFVMRESHTLSQLVIVLKTGDIVEINATNQEKTWVKILAKNSSVRGWLPISDLKIDFDLEVLPIAE